jgi:SAM-dependent methyltransferase
MDLGDQKFDLIICQQLIEHLHNPSTLLNKVKLWLDTRGVLILETPGIESIDRKIFKGCWGGYHIPRHPFLFSEKAIKLILDKYGFEVIDIFYDFCLAFWLWSLHNLIVKYIEKRKIARFFSLNNPLALLPFWIIEHMRMHFMKTASMGVVCRMR